MEVFFTFVTTQGLLNKTYSVSFLCGPTQYNVIFSGAVGLYIHSHIVIIGLCRATASEYVVPYWKFVKSFNHPVCIGMRFKFHFESEDVNERFAFFS